MSKGSLTVTNPHRTITQLLQFLSALRSILVSLSSLFWFYSPRRHCFGSLSRLSTAPLSAAADSYFQQSSALHQTNQVSDLLVNIVENFAAKE